MDFEASRRLDTAEQAFVAQDQYNEERTKASLEKEIVSLKGYEAFGSRFQAELAFFARDNSLLTSDHKVIAKRFCEERLILNPENPQEKILRVTIISKTKVSEVDPANIKLRVSKIVEKTEVIYNQPIPWKNPEVTINMMIVQVRVALETLAKI